MSEKNKDKKGGVLVLTIVLAACLAIAGFAAYKLISTALLYKAAEDEYAQMQTYTHEAETEPEEEAGAVIEAGSKEKPAGRNAPITVDFQELKNINPDFAGWIYLEAEDISYPVVYRGDNDYYLHRTFEGTENFAGALFIEALNKADFSDPNTIIYGHNMKNGTMFGKLKDLVENEDYKKSEYFWILTEEGNYKYRIFSIVYTTEDSDIYTLFSGPSSYVADYIYGIAALSEVAFPLENVTENSRIVTLSTCVTADSPDRLVVQGILVED